MTVPNNKTLILASICLSVVAAVGAYKIGEAQKIAAEKENSQGAVYIDLDKTNSEGALLQEALQKMNLDAALGTSTEENPFAPSESDTLTDTLAKNIFLSYANKEQGASALDDETIASNIIGAIDTSDLPQAKFSLSNVIIQPGTPTSLTVKAYGNAAGAVIMNNYKYIADRKDNMNLIEIAAVHTKIGEELIKIPVPSSMAQWHLAVANDYVILGTSFEIIGNEEKNDPVKSLLAVRSSRDASENLDKTHLEINNYFYKNDILFSNDEPGIVWARIVLK